MPETPFACPVCKEPLLRVANAYACAKNHHFDCAKEGYVNLLLANEKSSKDPGDSAEMVEARTAFLERGWYDGLVDAVTGICTQPTVRSDCTIADIGCGQGYYTQGITRSMLAMGKAPTVVGIDISKHAVRYAAKQEKDIIYAVAALKKLPLLDCSVDILLNIFAPRDFVEFARVTAKRGLAVIVSPGRNHLRGLKAKLLLAEDEHAEPVFASNPSLQKIDQTHIEYDITLTSPEDILQLSKMTPLWWKMTREGREQIATLTELTISLDFLVTVFRKSGR